VTREAEIDGVRTILDGRDQAFPIARRRQQFRLPGSSRDRADQRARRFHVHIHGRHAHPVSNFKFRIEFRTGYDPPEDDPIIAWRLAPYKTTGSARRSYLVFVESMFYIHGKS